MTALLAGLAGAGGVALAMAVAAPAEKIDLTDRAAIEKIVREYILTHPEILPEAMQNLQARETRQVVEANRKQIETPFAGAWEGAADADVVLVEFFDYACGYCRAARPDVDRLLAEDKKLKVVYRELPILGQDSLDAAKISLSAAQAGNYAAFHTGVYQAGRLTQATIAAARDKAKIDKSKVNQAAIVSEINANLQLQQALQLSGTPSWIIGDTVYNGAVGYEELKKGIAAARAAK